ncbi:glycosyl transferase, family 2 [gamma proteobacterium NOR5-3]|nr:glycosyl transferase, family 2 [gamma proteobacterium NOR5-3]
MTFVIPHKGREHFLRETLKGIDALSGTTAREVILVTQNQALEPDTLIAAGSTPLKVLHADERLTISALRNHGVTKSTHTHLAFLDADIVLSSNWLSMLLPMLDNDDVALVSAMQVNGPEAPPLEQIRTALSNATVNAAVDFLPGRNLLMHRETFDAVAGFPEHLVTCEDYYFTDRVAALGTLWYSSEASYVHLGEDKRLNEMFKKEIWRGQSNLLSLKGRRIEPGEWPSFVVPFWVSSLLILSVVLTMAGETSTALIALVLGALPFVAYVTRLYFLAQRRIGIHHIIAFYGYYFPARAWGTLVGAFRSLGRDLHNK